MSPPFSPIPTGLGILDTSFPTDEPIRGRSMLRIADMDALYNRREPTPPGGGSGPLSPDPDPDRSPPTPPDSPPESPVW